MREDHRALNLNYPRKSRHPDRTIVAIVDEAFTLWLPLQPVLSEEGNATTQSLNSPSTSFWSVSLVNGC